MVKYDNEGRYRIIKMSYFVYSAVNKLFSFLNYKRIELF